MPDKLNKLQLIKEATALAQYISGKIPSSEITELYIRGCKSLNLSGTMREELILKKAIKNSWMIPYLDAALAFPNHNALLRKKTLLLFSILETSNEHHHVFKCIDRSGAYWIRIFFIGCNAVFKWFAGKILIMFI